MGKELLMQINYLGNDEMLIVVADNMVGAFHFFFVRQLVAHDLPDFFCASVWIAGLHAKDAEGFRRHHNNCFSK